MAVENCLKGINVLPPTKQPMVCLKTLPMILLWDAVNMARRWAWLILAEVKRERFLNTTDSV